MNKLTWAQSRQRLMNKLARLDPALASRADDAEARMRASRDNYAAPEHFEALANDTMGCIAEANGVPEDSFEPSEEPEAVDSVPEYLR